MKIKICVENTDKLQDALDRAAGRCTAHVLTASALIDAAESAEEALEKSGVAKKRRAGARLVYCARNRLPSSYSYVANVQYATLRRGHRDWFLVYADMAGLHGGNNRLTDDLLLTPEQQADITVAALRRAGRRIGDDCVVCVDPAQAAA